MNNQSPLPFTYYFPYSVNVVVWNSEWNLSDIDSFFSDVKGKFDGPILIIDEKLLPNLLVKLKVCQSTSKAIQAGRKGEIPEGYFETKANKYGVTIYTLNCTHPHQYLSDSFSINQVNAYYFTLPSIQFL